ncbi:MAG TPA: IS982 family transposase [Herpetosiphonaceae bacterium]|nr:IS982 family transposase [Herpetosiphonaceae bacterium]
MIVDEIHQVEIRLQDHRPGPRSDFTESELLTVAIVAELIGLDEETAILGYLHRNHPTLFPLLPDCTRYNRRRRALGEAVNTVRRRVLGWLLALLPPDERPLCLIDSLPVPVVAFQHARDEHAWRGWASYGHNATKKQTIYGFKLHLLTTADGVIVDFVLAPAHHTDGTFTAQLLLDKYHLQVLGDKGYIDAPLQADLAAEQDIRLLTPKRANQRLQLPAGLTALINHFRQLIETVNSQLADQFHVETNKAKCMSGLVARLQAKLAAHTLGIYLNVLSGRSLLDLKALALI